MQGYSRQYPLPFLPFLAISNRLMECQMKTYYAVSAQPLSMISTAPTGQFLGFTFWGTPREPSDKILQKKVNGYDLKRHYMRSETLYVFENEQAAKAYAELFFKVENNHISQANPIFNVNVDDSIELALTNRTVNANQEHVKIVAASIQPSDATLTAAVLCSPRSVLATYVPSKWYETDHSKLSFVPEEYNEEAQVTDMTPHI